MADTPDTGRTEKDEKIFEGKSIVVIDDHPRVIQGYQMILGAYDATVIAFSSAHEFLDSFKKGEVRPDLLITDWAMPGGMDGLDLIRQLRESGYNIPIILTTALNTISLEPLSLEFKFTIVSKYAPVDTLLQAGAKAMAFFDA